MRQLCLRRLDGLSTNHMMAVRFSAPLVHVSNRPWEDSKLQVTPGVRVPQLYNTMDNSICQITKCKSQELLDGLV